MLPLQPEPVNGLWGTRQGWYQVWHAMVWFKLFHVFQLRASFRWRAVRGCTRSGWHFSAPKLVLRGGWIIRILLWCILSYIYLSLSTRWAYWGTLSNHIGSYSSFLTTSPPSLVAQVSWWRGWSPEWARQSAHGRRLPGLPPERLRAWRLGV